MYVLYVCTVCMYVGMYECMYVETLHGSLRLSEVLEAIIFCISFFPAFRSDAWYVCMYVYMYVYMYVLCERTTFPVS